MVARVLTMYASCATTRLQRVMECAELVFVLVQLRATLVFRMFYTSTICISPSFQGIFYSYCFYKQMRTAVLQCSRAPNIGQRAPLPNVK